MRVCTSFAPIIADVTDHKIVRLCSAGRNSTVADQNQSDKIRK